jgi:hypothetical protein
MFGLGFSPHTDDPYMLLCLPYQYKTAAVVELPLPYVSGDILLHPQEAFCY